MNKTSLVGVVSGALMVCSLLICPIGNAAPGEDQPESKVNKEDAGKEPEEYIAAELDKVGLDSGEIQDVGGNRYLVDVERFDSGSDAITTKGRFRPCTLKVKLEKGKIQMERCGLEDAGLIPNTKQFPSSLKIEEGDIWGRP